MAYVYEVSFDIDPQQVEQLEIGASLERVLGYLRVLLPSEPGFITARTMYSLDRSEALHIRFLSVWETWNDLTAHRKSGLSEDKVLKEFGSNVDKGALITHLYEEVS